MQSADQFPEQHRDKPDEATACFSEPSHWAVQFPSCGGLRQSPINIVTSKVHLNRALPPFTFIGHTSRINITVENKGHSGNEEPTYVSPAPPDVSAVKQIWFVDHETVSLPSL